MSGAKALIKALKREKVEVIFGLPGGAIMRVYDELYDADIRHILVRHEQSAAHMADGYARVSRRAGVCMTTSGPGATNLVTGLATAYMDSSPIVAITGQVPTSMIGKDAFQETDIIGISTPITKYNMQPRDPSEIPLTVKKAFYIATTGRPGPVLIDLPKDVQDKTADMVFPDSVKIRGYNPDVQPDPSAIAKAADMLLSAERPMIMSGGGVIIANAFQELQAVAEFLQAPVVTTFKGKGSFPENHPLSLGPVGMHGHPEANKLITEADVLLAVASRFSDRSVGRFDDFIATGIKIIHADIDPSEIEKNLPVHIPIIGDVKVILTELLKVLIKKAIKKDRTKWLERVEEVKQQFRNRQDLGSKEITAPKILKKLRELLPIDTIVTTEVGQNQMWASLHFDVIKPGTFFSSTGLGTMGFGFPAAIGAKVACPNVPVVDIAGDGSFGMTANSLATSVLEKIPVIVVILNNSVLGMVAQWQRMFYNRRMIAVDLHNVPDMVKLAEAYGAQGIRVQSMDEFSKAVRLALKSDVTTVIDVPISPEENVFPFVVPGSALKDMVLA
ncbi:MAG: biosynthetic-type acetolactate synthase large subunit [Nitrososphaerales archaeon]|nr:biosynthetic-type acetolactate synthase large subunit [Nitrososphaerales archaeon]